MKKNMFLAMALVMAFASCKKNNSTPDSPHLTLSVDGSSKTFNTGLTATKISIGSQESIMITGETSTSAGEVFSLIIGSSTAGSDSIVARTYVYTDAHTSFDATYLPSISGGTEYEAGSTFSQIASHNGITIANNMVLHITGIDAAGIKGNFTGDFYLNADPTLAKKAITSGDFYAKFQ